LTIKPGEDLSCRQNGDECKEANGQNAGKNESIEDREQVEAQEGKTYQHELQQETDLRKDNGEQTESQDINSLNELLEDKQREIEEYRNRWLRSQADFDNYKKRMQREIQDINLYAGEQLVKDILPVIDNFERALNSVKDEDDAFYKGVKLIYQQIVDVLNKHEIKEIEALGKPFDPNFHEAVMIIESEELEPDTVAEVLLKGYTYHSKVIRPSMVKVVKNQ
jgi:molecular chaperone GrpE